MSDWQVSVVKGRTGWRQEVDEKRVVWQRPRCMIGWMILKMMSTKFYGLD